MLINYSLKIFHRPFSLIMTWGLRTDSIVVVFSGMQLLWANAVTLFENPSASEILPQQYLGMNTKISKWQFQPLQINIIRLTIMLWILLGSMPCLSTNFHKGQIHTHTHTHIPQPQPPPPPPNTKKQKSNAIKHTRNNKACSPFCAKLVKVIIQWAKQ